MNNCAVCDGGFRNGHPNKIICDGVCRQSFHAECANFSKDALLCYREMPNLQWFCDGCIIQTRSCNVSSPRFNNFNSTSSSPCVQRTLIAAKNMRRRNRNAVKSSNNSSVFLVTRSANVVNEATKANDSVSNSTSANEKQAESLLVKSPSVYGTPTAGSSPSTDVLSKKSVTAQVSAEVESPTVRPRYDSMGSPNISTPSERHKVVYVSNFHPSITEKNVVNYLLQKNVISSAEDVSCKILLSPYVDINSVSFVSFRITVNSKNFHSIVNSKLWPEDVVVREFMKR